jgi:hypothetical protein
VDSYFLDAIGQLGDAGRLGLARVEPKLREVYKCSGSWQEIVRGQLDFDVGIDDQVRKIWSGYLEAAGAAGRSVSPNEFVEEFVSANFPDFLSE